MSKIFPKIESMPVQIMPTNLEDKDILKLLKYLGYPSLDEIELLKKLAVDLEMEIPSFLLSLNINEEKIKNLKHIEEECDILEISFANLKVEYDEIMELKKVNFKDLENQLEILNTDFNDLQFETKHLDLLNQAYAFLNQESVNKNILNMFRFVKRIKNYDLIIEKEDLIKQIEGNGVLNCIFMDLIQETSLRIENLENKYSLDKVLILKIVYGMTNNGIVSFDKETGTISLRK